MTEPVREKRDDETEQEGSEPGPGPKQNEMERWPPGGHLIDGAPQEYGLGNLQCRDDDARQDQRDGATAFDEKQPESLPVGCDDGCPLRAQGVRSRRNRYSRLFEASCSARSPGARTNPFFS